MNQLKTPALLLTFLLTISTLSGCARTTAKPTAEDLPVIKSIIVLPVEIETEGHDGRSAAEAQQMSKGQRLLDAILAEYFSNRENIRLLSAAQKEALNKNPNRNRTDSALSICRSAKADAVLIMSLHRFREREGSEYSIVNPASVEFDYKLLHGATGQVLCSGAFSETQQPLLDNVFQFFKKAQRGVKWLSAEELTREGFKQKISDCLFLKK